MTARITYNGVNVDFKIKRDTLDISYIQNSNENRSGSGKLETILLNSRMEIKFNAILTGAQYRQMFPFFAWARQGYEFAFTVDTTLMTSTTLDGGAAAGQKTIPLTSTAGFTAGDYCFIRNADNDNAFEIVQIDSVTPAVSIAAEDNLIYTYSSADTFRHWRYWPTARLVNTTFNPKDMASSGFYDFAYHIEEVDMPIARSIGSGEDYGTPGTLTLVAGVLTVPGPGYFLVATEFGDATDDLTEIQGLTDGQAVVLGPADGDKTIVIKNGANMKTLAGTDFSLDDTYDIFECLCLGGDICKERGRSGNE